MENKCPSCSEELPETGEVLNCSECDYSFHLGACSGISAKAFKTKDDSFKQAWLCSACKPQKSQTSKGRKQKSEVDMASLLANMNTKLDSLMTIKETVDNIEKTVKHLSDDYDDLLKKVNRHDGELKNIQKRMETIENQNQKSEIKQLKREMNDLEWRSRKLNLELHGIAKSENENLLQKVNEIAAKLELAPLVETDITAAHRLPGKPDKVPGIIVRFTKQSTRDAWLHAKKKLNKDRSGPFILENLTRHNRALLQTAKDWASDKQYAYVWHHNGSILVRKKTGDRAIVVKDEDDLQRIGVN